MAALLQASSQVSAALRRLLGECGSSHCFRHGRLEAVGTPCPAPGAPRLVAAHRALDGGGRSVHQAVRRLVNLHAPPLSSRQVPSKARLDGCSCPCGGGSKRDAGLLVITAGSLRRTSVPRPV
eukprot:CAMPEP_0114226198 /NCGR_PEP_ID=MMETSP0058-20121206/1104_1 /TAXON_ID=36894 /ORGANISM="Pyramimonas parkeae, CCMP726" /LENGTH=122 /DNA_ID=CAMNT_0001336907 /DNA_START=247 /DNA_END=615 /DNA_ORIENTATION=-